MRSRQPYEDKTGTFWVGTSEGLDAFDRDKGIVTLHVPLHGTRAKWSLSMKTASACSGSSMSPGGGLAVFDRKKRIRSLIIPSMRVTSLTRSPPGQWRCSKISDGTLWFATLGNGHSQI